MTLKRYKTLDIIILTVIALLADVIALVFTKMLLKTNYDNIYIAPSIVFILIIYIRWGKVGFISNAVLLIGQYTLYTTQIFESTTLAIAFSLGYLSLFLVTLWKKDKKESVISSGVKTVLIYYFIPYGLMILLEAGASYILGFQGKFMVFVIRHTTNFLLGMIVIIIAKMQKNFLVDMELYLLKQQKEKDEKKNEY